MLPLWDHTLILDVKGDDSTLTSAKGYRRLRGYPSSVDMAFGHDRTDRSARRYRIAPGSYSQASRPVWDQAIRAVWKSGRGNSRATWTLYADELRLLADPAFLGLRAHLDAIWISGRSRGITLVAGTQAPRFVPSSFYEQPRYFAIGRVRDARALRRLAEIGGDVDMVNDVVPRLGWHEWLILGPSDSFVTKLPGPKG